jgi:long-chain acyl-CoA synthetase
MLYMFVQVDKCRSVLASHNIGRNDKVAMISDNRVEWAVTYFAANSLGAQIIPMYQVQVPPPSLPGV